ncbi:hypothetical protein G6F31_016197 [Rhizopus arrhizus]|nr:hypothetical protein G6F31_016197 [Rhizopus arrhizus]
MKPRASSHSAASSLAPGAAEAGATMATRAPGRKAGTGAAPLPRTARAAAQRQCRQAQRAGLLQEAAAARMLMLRGLSTQPVAPLAYGQSRHRQAADPDAAQGLQLQARGIANEFDETRQRRLQRKAQMGFVLPADLHGGGRPPFVRQATLQPGQVALAELATDLRYVFLLDELALFHQLARYRVFLRVDDQAAGRAFQRRDELQAVEHAL